MNRRRLTLIAAIVAAIGVVTLSVVIPRATSSSAHVGLTNPFASPAPTAVATSRPPAPSPSASTSTQPVKPTPKPTTSRPHPSTSKPSGQPASSITAASLGIPGAGTLKIPAWPNQPGMRYRGPYGSMGSTGTTSVALTFDDGPGPYTSQILDILDRYHVKATFCIIGRQVNAYRAVVARMIADGMTICNHSWDHDESLGRKPPAYEAANMQKMINAIHSVSATAQVAYFRNPGGNVTPTSVRVCELLGMRPLYWTEDTDDWKRPGTAAIEHDLLTQTHRDSIVLMHDGGGDRSETVAALRATLPTLLKRYHLIALSNARTVPVNPGTPAPPPPAPSPSDSPSQLPPPSPRP